jgi:hypothetical protein
MNYWNACPLVFKEKEEPFTVEKKNINQTVTFYTSINNFSFTYFILPPLVGCRPGAVHPLHSRHGSAL